MTGLVLGNPAGLWLAVLAIPVVALHVVRPRWRQVTVPSTMLWRAVTRRPATGSPWQRLRWNRALALQLLAVALLAAAAADPMEAPGRGATDHVVFIIDASASMGARDGEPDRLASARRAATERRTDLDPDTVASIVVASDRPYVALAASSSEAHFGEALSAITVSGAPMDVATTASLAAGIAPAGSATRHVLVSDGGLGSIEQRLLPAGTELVAVGEADTNRGIASLTVEPLGDQLVVHVAVRNGGSTGVAQRMRIDVDGRTAAVEDIELSPRTTLQRDVTVPAGERVEARLEGEDLLGTDDHAYALASGRPTIEVVVMGPPEPYLDRALAVLPGVEVTRRTEPGPADGFDVAIYDGVSVPADPGAPYLAIAPPDGAGGIVVGDLVTDPAVTLVQTERDLLRGLDLSEVLVSRAQDLTVTGDQVLVAAAGTPLLVTGTRRGRPFAYLGFTLADSNLGLQIAYPVLIDRLVSQLSGAGAASAGLQVGDRVDVGGERATIHQPQGRRQQVEPGAPAPIADRAGFWTVEREGRAPVTVAVNAPAAETDVAPETSLDAVRPAEANPGPPDVTPAGQRPRSWRAWILAAALLVLAAEAAVTVGPLGRTAPLAVAGRVAVAALVIAALVDPTTTRRRDEVTTIFLVDGSASMGEAGRQAALAWVEEARMSQPSGARSGVVEFAATAQLLDPIDAWQLDLPPTAGLDRSGTDLPAALRAAAALLPDDARRRVVVVSDGRIDGDATSATEELAARGIAVEVHPVTVPATPDVAVTDVDVPSSVRTGEVFTVRSTVSATQDSEVRVTTERDGAVMDERLTRVPAGESHLELELGAGEPGLSRLRVSITTALDTVPDNDTGHAAVQVEGPARVLVVEGAPREGRAVAAAMESGGLTVEVVGAADLPSRDELLGYGATVLVDVSVDQLSSAQVDGLVAATRDGGRGLVTVGGERAYALGGYRHSALEQVLPVVSEVDDPQTDLRVAQVLAIDASGSMGACHCDETGVDSSGEMTASSVEGGVNKTDISKAAAARTIEAMNANDEVGVLAFNAEQHWIVPLQELPAETVVTEGLRTLTPSGETDVLTPLLTAAEALRASRADLKHIILFTDGFTYDAALEGLTEQAAALAGEGITVSVLATGEVAHEKLAAVAQAGHGRFYAGRDLTEIPELMVQESIITARDVVQEGSFAPAVVAPIPTVDDLATAPALAGFVAVTAKAEAQTVLTVGDGRDPLLVTWRAGLGRVTSWTSDASQRWSRAWAGWPGYGRFWTAVVKDALPLGGVDGDRLSARVIGDRLEVELSSGTGWPDGSTASARVNGPGLDGVELPLARTGAGSFTGALPVADSGSYAVGALVSTPAGDRSFDALAAKQYADEYRPGAGDPRLLLGVSARTGGRGAIEAAQSFDVAGLPAGTSARSWASWLLVAAGGLWVVAVAAAQLRFGRR